MKNTGLMQTNFEKLNLINRGKVRDIYEIQDKLLIVTTDRISAFDVIMPNPVPDKGKVLTAMSTFWFREMEDIIQNHIIATSVDEFPPECDLYADVLRGRSMLVKKAKPLPFECIIRGYLSGSGWNDYCGTGIVSGIKLPQGLKESSKLPEPIFTPSTKAEEGEHDLAISREVVENLIGRELTEKVVSVAVEIYKRASSIANKGGIIIADTKMEFGFFNDELIIIDELLTPDSSRFWPKNDYQEGRSPKSFDKQFLRDYLLSINWNKRPPAPVLPENIVHQTSEKYKEALKRIVG